MMMLAEKHSKQEQRKLTRTPAFRTISDLSKERAAGGSREGSLLGSRNLDAVVGAKLSNSTVDRFLVGSVGARGRNAGVQLSNGGLVGAKARPAVVLITLCSIPAAHAVVPGATRHPSVGGCCEESSSYCEGLHVDLGEVVFLVGGISRNGRLERNGDRKLG